jgi:hypothetical protein
MESDLPFDIARSRPEVQAHYLRMIAEGQSPRWAEMCALQQPPGTQGTDRAFFQGRNNGEWLDSLPKRQAEYILREAKQAGIDTTGKYYLSGLADKRGWLDGEAWVSDVADIKRVAIKRNLNVSGIVKVDGREVEPTTVDLNPKIARSLAKKEIDKNPKLTMKEAVAIVKERAVPHWKKKGK